MGIALQLLGSGGTVEQLKANLMGSAEYYFLRGGGNDGAFERASGYRDVHRIGRIHYSVGVLVAREEGKPLGP